MQEVTRGILMKVRYIGNKGSNLSVIKGHIYQCLGQEHERLEYRSLEDELEKFIIILEDSNKLKSESLSEIDEYKKDFEIVED